MASNEFVGQNNSELRTIIQKYDPFLGLFQTFNALLLEKFQEFDGHLQNWIHRPKPIDEHLLRSDEVIGHMFQQLKNITAYRDLSKSVNGSMKDLYDSISAALKGITHSTDLVCDSGPGVFINSDFQFKSSHPTSSNCLLIDVLLRSAEERQRMDRECEIVRNKLADQQSGIDLYYHHFFPPTSQSDQDVAGWGPTDRILPVLMATVRNYKSDGKLLELIAELCTKYELLIGEFHFQDYQCLTKVLFEDNTICDDRLSTLWYFTKCFLAKSRYLNRSQRFEVWPFFQDLLQKYC